MKKKILNLTFTKCTNSTTFSSSIKTILACTNSLLRNVEKERNFRSIRFKCPLRFIVAHRLITFSGDVCLSSTTRTRVRLPLEIITLEHPFGNHARDSPPSLPLQHDRKSGVARKLMKAFPLNPVHSGQVRDTLSSDRSSGDNPVD